MPVELTWNLLKVDRGILVLVCETHPLSPLPTRPARGVVAGQRHSHPSLLCLQDPHEVWSPVRDTRTSLSSAYKTRTRCGCRSEMHTPSLLCLQDPHEAWSPVRDAHPLSPMRTRPARGVVAGQRHSHPSLLCLQHPHEVWSPVRDTRTPLSSAYKTRTRRGRRSETLAPLSPLPTTPARGVVAGQRHSHPSLLCLQHPHEVWSPVRDTRTPLSSAYKTRTRCGRRSETHTPSLLCVQDPHEAWSPVRDTRTPLSSAYNTRTRCGRRSETHTPSVLCLQLRPARGVVAGQRRTPPLSSAYKTRTRHGLRSETLAPLGRNILLK